MNISFKEEEGFYKELFITCFLIIISLGFYLPWGMTNIRKNIWSKISLNGERFHYIGNAKELAFGYLLLIGILGISKLFQYGAPVLFSSSGIIIGAFSFVGSLAFFTVLYKSKIGSFRYQVNRTVYSGVRFSTDLPGPKDQYIMCLKWAFITLLTLGLGFWYFSFKADQFKYNGLMYGDEKFNFTMTFGDYANIVVKNSLVGLAGFIGGSTLFVFSKGLLGGKTSFFEMDIFSILVLSSIVIFLIFFYLFLTSSLFVNLFKAKLDNLSSRNVSFETSITVTRAMRYHLINTLIIIFTLGLGFPLVLANNIKLYAKTIQVHGFEDLVVSNHRDNKEGKLSSSFDDMFADGFDLDLFDAF